MSNTHGEEAFRYYCAAMFNALAITTTPKRKRKLEEKTSRSVLFYHFACEKDAVQFKWYAIITVTRVRASLSQRLVKTRANFNHFVLMESTRSVFKQLVQSGYIHFSACLWCLLFSRFTSISNNLTHLQSEMKCTTKRRFPKLLSDYKNNNKHAFM